MSPHLKFLHMTRKFSTDNVRGVRDKYQVLKYDKNVQVPSTCLPILEEQLSWEEANISYYALIPVLQW